MRLACVLFPLTALGQVATEPARFREEAFERSRVMEYASALVDGIGARLTGSASLDRAVQWAVRTLGQMGLAGVRAEPWGRFGMGWTERNTWLRMTAPAISPMVARAAPWSPATRGIASGAIVKVPGFRDAAQFAAWRGKLRGKIVLLGTAPSAPEVRPLEQPLFTRLTEAQLTAWTAMPYEPPSGYEDARAIAAARFDIMEKTGRFLAAEGALAVLVPSGNNAHGGASGGTIHLDSNYTFGWYVYERERRMRVPLAVVAIEDYGRLERLATRGSVSVELNIDTETTAADRDGVNVFADIPGGDPARKDELVMVAAHLDSWSGGTGATDDGAGVLIAMEAMRILKTSGVKPRRTIRLALWTGEEQGSLGSRAWASAKVAAVDYDPRDQSVPLFLRRSEPRIRPLSLYEKLAAVYTLDAGGGKIRGISTGNPSTVAMFRQWLAPLADLGVTMVAGRADCGGDCWTFDQIGIPTPSFKQDPLSYESRTHHTNFDTWEHLIEDDLKQAASVVATMVYQTAIAEEKLPRRPRSQP